MLADLALKGSLVLLAALLAAHLLRRAPAASRHLVWTSALAALLAMPAAALVLPTWRVPLPRAFAAALGAALGAAPPAASVASVAMDTVHHADPAVEPLLVPRASLPPAVRAQADRQGWISCRDADCADRALPRTAATAATRDAAAPRNAPSPSRDAWLLALWAVGATLVLLRLALGVVGVARVARRARPVADAAWLALAARVARELGIRRPVTLLVTERRTVPLTWGVVYPVVLLPAEAATWDDERRRLVLLHELAHVRRLDALTHVVTQGALALAWFHPLAWLAARRVRVERELACDDVVLAHGTRPSRYADDLLDIARLLQEARGAPGFGAMALAPLAMARPSELEWRLRAILDPRRRRGGASRGALLLTVVATGALVLPLVALRPATAVAQRAAATPVAPAAPLDPGAPGTAVAPLAPVAPVAPAVPASIAAAVPSTGAPVAVLARDSVPTCRDGDGSGRLRGLSVGRGDTFLTHSDGRTTTHLIRDGDDCVRLELRGAVELGEDDGSLRAGDDGWVLIAEAVDGAERVLVDRGGDRRFYVNGRQASVAEGDAWLRAELPELLRRTGFAAEQRVARLHRRGGTAAVLAELAQIRGDGVRRVYLTELLDQDTLDADELAAVAREAGRLRSDGDQRLVLLALLEQPATPADAVLDAVRGIASDGDRRLVLVALAPRLRDDAAARFADAAREIGSDGDLRLVLMEWLEHGGSGVRAVPALLATAGAIASDGDRRLVLVSAARQAPLGEPAVRDAFFAAANGMRSSGERRLVLLAALDAGRLDAAGLTALLHSAARIDSDGDKALVLVRAAGHPALRDREARAAFDMAARTIESESAYGRVMRAAGR